MKSRLREFWSTASNPPAVLRTGLEDSAQGTAGRKEGVGPNTQAHPCLPQHHTPTPPPASLQIAEDAAAPGPDIRPNCSSPLPPSSPTTHTCPDLHGERRGLSVTTRQIPVGSTCGRRPSLFSHPRPSVVPTTTPCSQDLQPPSGPESTGRFQLVLCLRGSM